MRKSSDSFWCQEKVKKVFMILCKKSFEPSVNWNKFRQFDPKGIFSKYANAQLSMKFRKLWLIENGLCYYCGINSPNKAGLCDSCYTRIRSYKETGKIFAKKK